MKASPDPKPDSFAAFWRDNIAVLATLMAFICAAIFAVLYYAVMPGPDPWWYEMGRAVLQWLVAEMVGDVKSNWS